MSDENKTPQQIRQEAARELQRIRDEQADVERRQVQQLQEAAAAHHRLQEKLDRENELKGR